VLGDRDDAGGSACGRIIEREQTTGMTGMEVTETERSPMLVTCAPKERLNVRVGIN
jgi:hypothetical protein